jgi:SpoVT / AbrB like domain.
MTKITKSGKQYIISIPKEIIQITGWDENTEVIITPHMDDPTREMNADMPILIRKIKVNSVEEKEDII